MSALHHIIDKTSHTFSSQWKLLAKILLPAFALILLNPIGLMIAETSVDSTMGFMIIHGITTFIYTIASIIASFAMIKVLIKGYNNESISELYKDAGKHIIPLIVISILTIIAIALGFIAFIIPGIALMIYLTFAVMIYADNPTVKNISALKASYNLVKHNWWNVFIHIALFQLCVLIISLVLGAFFGGFYMLIPQVLQDNALIMISLSLPMYAFQFFVTLISLIYTVTIYKALKEYKNSAENKPITERNN